MVPGEVDPSEYEPQVVELPPEPSPAEQDDEGVRLDRYRINGGTSGRGTLGNENYSEKKRTQRWIEILVQIKKRYLAAMTDEDRQRFLEKLES